MIGRLDLTSAPCDHCVEMGRDPKKRNRPCPKCHGTKKRTVCKSCGEDWPCSGENPNIMDQSYCMKGEF